jgi:hypothetical protein
VELLILAVVAGLSFASWALWRQARGAEGARALPDKAPAGLLGDGERTIHTLRPGDVVAHMGTDYLVEGALALDEDGRVTRLYRLVDGSVERWMGARPNDASPLLFEAAPDLSIEANGPESITHRGLPFRLTARASALVSGAGQVGEGREGGRVQLYEYTAAGAARIWAIAWAQRVEAFSGERIEPHTVELLPGA